MTIAGDILRETAALVDGDRNATHGDKTSSFSVIAEFWQIYLDGRKKHDDPLSARDVAMMMTLLKVARSIQGEPVQDHFKDAAGYCAIGAECAEAEARLGKLFKSGAATPPEGMVERVMSRINESIHDRIAETETTLPKCTITVHEGDRPESKGISKCDLMARKG